MTPPRSRPVRIVSGKFRRRRLHTNPGLVTRPILDRVKETVFEFLGRELDGKRFADVFAGTGTIGLEALSRGAASVVFIESDRRAHQLLRQNVETLGVEKQTLCWRADVLRCSFHPQGVDWFLPYDVVFIDPPYRMIPDLQTGSPLYKSLERLARESVTAPEALLLLRTPERAEFQCPPAWQSDRKMDVSSMEIHWFRKRPAG